MRCLQYKRCAGPQKQEVINDRSSIIFWKKNGVRGFFYRGNQGNFLVQDKKNCEKKIQIFFQRNLTYSSQKLKILIFKT